MKCYLCDLCIPHNEVEHAEVLEGGLKAMHSGHYPGMTNAFKSDRFPTEAGKRIVHAGMSYEECVKAYMRKGKSRRMAEQLAKFRMKRQPQTIDQPKVEKDMDTKQFNSLTVRGKQIIRLVAQGLLNKEIASKLEISEKTVKAHVTDMMQRIGVKTRTQAAIAFLTFQQSQGQTDGSKDAGEGGEAGQTIEGPKDGFITLSEDALDAIRHLRFL